MKPGPWKKVEQLYNAALEREPSQREAFLQEACGGDEALLREVKSLLGADERADRFIEQPAGDAATQEVSAEESRSWLERPIPGYEVLQLVGAGGMGEVYRAKDTKLGREVALKVLPTAFAQDPERVNRFKREAQVLAALNHPHIAVIHGLEESDGRQVLVLELVEGETLAERIARGPIPLAEALPLFRQIAAGLEAAHEKGIVHRDLKPANVKITPSGQVKILDFGLAKAFREGASGTDVDSSNINDFGTSEGRVLGTVSYMSPEQARGHAVDKRTDVWAFGCVLYEALTGRRPFEGETVSDTLAAVLEHEVDWAALPEQTAAPIRSLLRRCLRRDKERRLHDIADARIEIEEVLAEPQMPGPTAAGAIRARPGWRQAMPWASTALLAIIAVVAVWSPWRSGHSPPVPRPVAFSIDLPAERHLDSGGMVKLAMSPDGTRLAYTSERAGRTQLFLRELDTLDARPLPGTGGAWAPFFSPDGEWVGFFAEDGTLQKIAVTGGAPVTICDAQAGTRNTGATWGLDDTIVYSNRGQEGGLWRVSAGGGTPEKLGLGRFPQILPDGKSVLFTVNVRPGGAAYRPAVLSLETGETRTLDRGRMGARYVRSGHLVYGESGSLMAIRFDPNRAELRGSPEPILDEVYMHPHEMAAISVSESGTLAYVPGRYETTLEWVDREGRTTPWLQEEGTFMRPRLSPDGRRVAIVRLTPGSRFDIWVYDVERGTRHRLTDEGVFRGPVWTPDGTRITFGTGSTLFWRRADGSGPAEPLRPGASALEGRLVPFSWSPDGRLLAFRRKGDIWVLPLEGDPLPVVATSAFEGHPRFSPDGRWLAYVSSESGRVEVYVQPYPGPGERRTISTDGGTGPVWSPDGRELLYRDASRRVMSVSFRSQPTVRVGKPRLLFEGHYLSFYDIHPDGQRFLMMREAPVRSVNVVLNWFEELERLVPDEK